MADEAGGSASAARRMTDAEALMWSAEQDPMFSSTIGTLLICDGPVGRSRLARRMAAAVAEIPRLRQRVVAPRPGRLGPPEWRTDADFELDYHVRHLSLPAPGDQAQLLELTTRLLQDPFDRTRPLWQFTAIDGLAGERGGLLVKLHHTVTDGQGGVRLAERYMDIDRDGFVPPDVDLDALIARSVAEEDDSGAGPADMAPAPRTAAGGVARTVGLLRRLAGEAALTMADPGRLPELAEDLGGGVRHVVQQLVPGEPAACSPVWRTRSRRRRLEVLSLPFAEAKQAAGALGGTLNDFFVAGTVEGAARYHRERDIPVEQLTVTFIISTRSGRSEGGNAFTPAKAVVPAGPLPPAERFAAVRDVLATRRHEVGGEGLLSGVAGVANLLPPSLTNRLAKAQSGAVDFATSNVRAAPFDVYIAGAKVLGTYPIGPVAGTAWNLTLMSYAGRLHLGLHVDPAAVPDVERLVSSLVAGYGDLFHAAGVDAEASSLIW